MNQNDQYDIIIDTCNNMVTIITKIDINFKIVIMDILYNNPNYKKYLIYRILTFNELVIFKGGVILGIYSNKDPKIIPIVSNIDEYINETMIKLQLSNLRKYNHKTQKELADITGLSTQCISNLETIDSEQSSTLRTISKYLNAFGYELSISPKFNKGD